MCYSCLAKSEGASWANFDHSNGSAQTDGYRADHGSEYEFSDYQSSLDAARMAAGAPFYSTFFNWVETQYNKAYDWISNNVSASPLSMFSALQYTLPGGRLGNVKYYTPNDLDSDVLALFSGSQWAISTVRYGFPDSRGDYQTLNPSANGYKPLNFDSEQAVRYILEGSSIYGGGPRMGLTSVEGFTNLGLEYAGRDGADIQVAGFNPNSMINRSHGYYPGVPSYGGDTWMDANSGLPGSSRYYTFIHELGHVLGLKHPHESGGRAPKMSAAHDSQEYTVMSYNSFSDKPQTFMQYDVAALQAMYGADFNENSGNTTYRWSPDSGQTFVNASGQGEVLLNKIFLTIWDGGGIDTYDFSAFSEGGVIDLAPGGFSRFSTSQLAKKSGSTYAKGNVYNAFQYKGDTRSLIENVIAGSGNDKINGNTANNNLMGGAGNDTINGAAGHDKVLGGIGNDNVRGGDGYDALYGEAGDDWIAGEAGNDYVEGNDGDDIVGGQDGNDTVYGGAGNDQVWGGAGQDTMRGGDGNDALYGEAGDDWIAGESGNDFVDGNAGNDIVGGQDGNDTVYGGSGYDQVWGGAGNDVMRGGDDNDWLYGEAGDDWIAGEAGNDYVEGNDGDDIVGGQDGNDTVYGGAGNDQVWGGAGQDTMRGGDGHDVLYGEAGNDWIAGEAGNDYVEGNDGDDIVGGQDGNDTIIGGAGNDEMWGGTGRDLFVFNTALSSIYNVDQIKDFSVAEDQIRLDRSIFSALGSTVSLSTGASATSWGPQVIYNSATGELFYDADGAGQLAQVKFAVLSAGLALTSANFVL